MEAKVQLALPGGLRELTFTPGEDLCDFLGRNGIDVTEYTIVVDGQEVTAEEAEGRKLKGGETIIPVPEVTNG